MLPPYKIMIINKKQLIIIIIVIKIVTIIYQIILYIYHNIYNIILYMYISLYNYIYIYISISSTNSWKVVHHLVHWEKHTELHLDWDSFLFIGFCFDLFSSGNFRYSAGNRNSWCISNTCVSAYKWPIFHCEGQGSEGVLSSKPFFPTITWFTTCR